MTALTAPTTPLTVLAGIGPKTIEKIEAAGIPNLEKLASMTPEQLMEIPGIGEKMVDKIYQAVNRFYEGGEAAAATVEVTDEVTDENGEVAPAAEAAPESGAQAAVESPAETAAETETSAKSESASEVHSEAAASTENETPAEQQEEKSS
jgi:transcription termination/antitermination protein NusA